MLFIVGGLGTRSPAATHFSLLFDPRIFLYYARPGALFPSCRFYPGCRPPSLLKIQQCVRLFVSFLCFVLSLSAGTEMVLPLFLPFYCLHVYGARFVQSPPSFLFALRFVDLL